MGWTDPSGHVWAVGEVVSAANMNTYLRLNLEVVDSGSKGQHLIMNDAESAPAYAPGIDILDRDLVQAGPVNNAAETTLYSHEIGAGIMGTTGGVKLTLGGVYKNNSGANDGLIIRVKYGGTTILESAAIGIKDETEERAWHLQVLMMNSTANAQKCTAMFMLSQEQITGDNFHMQHTATTSGRTAGVGYDTAAEDSTGALVLAVTADLEAAAATIYMYKEMALLERIAA